MKKYLLIGITIFVITNSYSQTEKGKKIIGGQISLSGRNNSYLGANSGYEQNSFGFQIAPNVGYFIKNNFAIGASLDFGISNHTTEQKYPNQTPSIRSTKSNTVSYGGGGFARYYKNITDNFFFCMNGRLSYQNDIEKLKYSNNDTNYVFTTSNPASQEVQTNNITFSVSPGLVYFINPKFGIQAFFGSLYYTNISSKNKSLPNDNHNNTNNYGVNLNVSSFNLGLNYYF